MDRTIGDFRTMQPDVGRGIPASPSSAGNHAPALADGDTLGQYKIVRLLGRGGMGEVYEAENTVNRKRVALKILPRSATGGTFVDRFRVESRVMMDLRHPRIVQVHHAGEERGLYYLTMDLVLGPDGEPVTLEDLLRERGRLDEDEALAAARQLCEALDYAHGFRGQGVVHRDLKPGNVLVTAEGELAVTDFGLAKVVGGEYLRSVIDRSMGLSMAGGLDASLGDLPTEGGTGSPGSGSAHSSTRALLGTYEFMAPEQKAGGEVTARTDIYALGLILYRMLTGRKAEGRWKEPSQLGCAPAWDDIVGRCLETDPADRWQNVADLRRAVEGVGTAPSGKGGTAKHAKHAKGIADQSSRGFAGTSGRGWTRMGKWAAALALLGGLAAALMALLALPGGALRVQRQRWPFLGQAIRIEGLGLDLEWVGPGSFWMGSNDGDDDEKPVREVRISRGFWLGKVEVTQREYYAIMGENPSKYKGDDLPVENVSWHKAAEFCGKLNVRERAAERLPKGYVYRLPTEAEWEYAARGGNQSRGFTYAGSDNVDEVAWYFVSSGAQRFCDFSDETVSEKDIEIYAEAYRAMFVQRIFKANGRQPVTSLENENRSHPVGEKRPNELGLYDMSGNVREWCHDWYYSGYYGKAPATDPVNTAFAPNRVIRGGSWGNSSRVVRSANRYWGGPNYTSSYLGFRVCLAPQVRE